MSNLPLYMYAAVLDGRTKKNACQYYRIEIPLRYMFRKKYAECFFDDGRYPKEVSLHNHLSSDIWLMFAAAGEHPMYMVKEIRKLKPGLAMDGKTMRYPPSIVFDIDDNVEYVHPLNPTFCRFGIRSADGTKLQPGDTVACKLDDGREIDLWQDRVSRGDHEELFDIEHNNKFVSSIHDLAKAADGCTFPSEYLGRWYQENHGIKDWYFFPNSVVEEDYPQVDLAPHEGTRIMWQGGFSHAVDWYPIKDVLAQTIMKHDKTHLTMWGSKLYPVQGPLPDDRFTYMRWMDYGAYKPWRALVDADINLCPLVDNVFNSCKSAIKFYEGSILKRPEATLAAKVPPYSDEIIDGETGMLYTDERDFVEKLNALIENRELRMTIADNAKRWVLANRSADQTVEGLHEYYQFLREKKVAEFAGTQVVSVGG